MSKILLIAFFLLTSISLLFPREPVVLEEIYSPNKIKVFNNKLYIAQETTLFIYSLKDLSLIKKFGRKCEGPGEVVFSPFFF